MPPPIKRDALVFIINVGKSSSEVVDGGQSFLTKAKNIMQNMIQRKIFICPKDEIGIIAIGTAESKNRLQFCNLTASECLQVPDWDTVAYVKNLNSSSQSSIWPEGVHVACDMIEQQCLKGGRKYTKINVTLLNNFLEDENVMNQFNSDTIMEEIKKLCIQLLVIGKKPIEDEPESNLSSSERLVLKVCQKTKGFYTTLEAAEKDTVFYGPPLIKPMQMKVVMQYADIIFPIGIYKMVDEDSFKPKLRSSLKKTTMVFNNQMNPISKGGILNACKFGHHLIPLTQEDEEKMKYVGGKKSMQIIDFIKKDGAIIDLWSKDAARIVLASSDSSEFAVKQFISFVNAMLEQQVAAIVRLVLRDGDPPKMGFLFPHVNAADEFWGCVFVPINFEEQMYNMQSFKPISKDIENKITPELVDGIDNVINSTMLVEDEEHEEPFEDGNVYNPSTQVMWNCIAHRILNPNAILSKEAFSHLYKVIQQPDYIKQKSASYIKKLREITKISDKIPEEIKINEGQSKVMEQIESENTFSEKETQEHTESMNYVMDIYEDDFIDEF